MGMVGMRFEQAGVKFEPCVPKSISHLELRNLNYRKMKVDVTIERSGLGIKEFRVNGKICKDAFLAADRQGEQKVTIVMVDGI